MTSVNTTTLFHKNSLPVLKDERNRENRTRSGFYEENFLPTLREFMTADSVTTLDKLVHMSKRRNWRGFSASEQYTPEEMKLFFHAKLSPRIVVVDTREETHFYIGKMPVYVRNKKNNVNQGKSTEQILEEEKNLIEKFQQASLATVNIYKKVNGKRPQVEIAVEDAYTEKTLVEKLGGKYQRIPVTDHGFFSGEQIDQIIKIFDESKKNPSWVLFHCGGGHGRSAKALGLYAILHWAKYQPLEEIFFRLESRKNDKLIKPGKAIKPGTDPHFWSSFHIFARLRIEGMKWTDWLYSNSKKDLSLELRTIILSQHKADRQDYL